MSAQHIAGFTVPRTSPRSSYPHGMPERIAAIVLDVATKYGVTTDQIVGPDRRPLLAYARFEAAFRLRHTWYGHAFCSYPRIGRWLGGRDHTTIIHACRRWAEISGEVL